MAAAKCKNKSAYENIDKISYTIRRITNAEYVYTYKIPLYF